MCEPNSATGDRLQGGDSAALRDLRSLCREKRSRTHHLVARCYDAGLLTDKGQRQYQIELKRLGALRKNGGPDAVREAIDRHDELQEHYSRRLRQGGLDVPGDDPTEVLSDDGGEPDTSESDTDDDGSSEASVDSEHPETASHGGQVDVQAHIRTHRTDELSPEQTETVSRRRMLIHFMQRGDSAREAVERLGIDRSPRWARRLNKRYEEEGIEGLYDKRWRNRGDRKVLSADVRLAIMRFRKRNRIATVDKIHELVAGYCDGHGRPVPSYESVRKYLEGLPEATRIILEEGVEQYDEDARPTVLLDRASYGNEAWELDQTPLPIWMRTYEDGEWVPTRPYLTAAVDVFSTSVAGYVLTADHPNVDTVLRLMRRAIQPKDVPNWTNQGMPEVVVTDHGGEFMANSVTTALNLLGIRHEPAPPDYPQGKPHVERYFGTVDTSFTRGGLPGHVAEVGKSKGAARKRIGELATLEMIEEAYAGWLVEEHNGKKRSGDRRTRRQRWEETVRVRMPADDELNTLLRKTNKPRTVRRTGVQLTIEGTEHRYWAPFLIPSYRQKVHLRYTPDDPRQVLVYSAATGRFLGEAYDLRHPESRYSGQDLKEARREFRRGKKKWIDNLEKHIEEEEERRRARMAWEAAHENDGAPGASTNSSTEDTEADPGVETLNAADREEEVASAEPEPGYAVLQDGIEALKKADQGEL